MTNSLDMLAATCPCQSGSGSDFIPLLVIAAILVAAHLLRKALTKWKGKMDMKNVKSIVIVSILAVSVGVVVAVKQRQAKPVAASVESMASAATVAEKPAALPRLVDLGATKCIPCKMMVPILEDLKTTYAGKLNVEFIDVWQNPEPGQKYGIRVIPTQIFFAADGKELFRHEGFFSKEDILAKWKEFGVELSAGNPQ